MEDGNTIGLGFYFCCFGIPVLCWLFIFVFYPVSQSLLKIIYSWPSPLLRPTEEDVVGTWHLSRRSVEYLQSIGHTVSAQDLVFEDNNILRIERVSNVWGHLARSPEEQYISGSGRWHIQHTRSWEVVARLQVINGHVSEANILFRFKGRMPPYELGVPLGNDGVIFERVMRP